MSDSVAVTLATNYEGICLCCGITPTVRVIERDKKRTHEMNICGACVFGEADCADPANWITKK